ncbi:MAG: sulfur carrier protein ThiS [Terriglobales bacterium]
MKGDRVAIERNREIVSRDRWSEVVLAEGDRLEIVHFVGGGCTCGAGLSSRRAPG